MQAIARLTELPFSDGTGDPHAQNAVSEWLLSLRHAQIPLQSSNCLTILHGHSLVFRLGLHVAADRALAGEPVLYLDGAHAFEPFLIGRLVRAHRQNPQKILAKIHVARAFTCHQMERLVSDCLGDALLQYQARLAVVSGIFESFCDESVSRQEQARLVGRMLQSIRTLVRQGYAVICLCPSPVGSDRIKHKYLDQLCGQADRVIRIAEEQGVVRLEEDRRRGGQSWEIARTVLEFK